MLPYTSEKVTISGLTSEQINNQFIGETVSGNSIELNVLDMSTLKITNTVYGNLETVDDVYAYSITTGRVYYVKGIEIDGNTYYTATEGLKSMLEIPLSGNNLSSIIFVPNVIGYTNEPINVTVKIPNTFSNISISTSDTSIQIGTQTAVGDNFEYIVNTNNVEGNYEITVSYTDGEQNYTTKYVVSSYDTIKPVISSINKDNFKATRKTLYLVDIIATDQSGIKYFKYIPGEIAESEAKEYFQTNGNNIIGKKINLSSSINEYTLYAEDNAGNFVTFFFNKLDYITTTIGELVASAANYGDTVDYSANGVNKWRVFYNQTVDEEEYVYLIATERLAKAFIPTRLADKVEDGGAGATILDWNIYWKSDNVPSTSTTIQRPELWLANWSDYNTNINVRCISYFLDETYWEEFKNAEIYGDNVIGAIGTPTVEMFVESWNAKGAIYNTDATTLYEPLTLRKGGSGYYITTSNISTADDLYIWSTDSGTLVWLASPSSDDTARLLILHWGGAIVYDYYSRSYIGVRPVVCLKSSTPAYAGYREALTDIVLIKD